MPAVALQPTFDVILSQTVGLSSWKYFLRKNSFYHLALGRNLGKQPQRCSLYFIWQPAVFVSSVNAFLNLLTLKVCFFNGGLFLLPRAPVHLSGTSWILFHHLNNTLLQKRFSCLATFVPTPAVVRSPIRCRSRLSGIFYCLDVTSPSVGHALLSA